MILIIDNYDSFTYNLVQLAGRIRSDITVKRNDKITVDEIRALAPDGIIISPGPGRPEDAGICIEVLRTLGDSFPIFGVCLGHQAIGHAFGGSVVHAPTLMHGKVSQILHKSLGVFNGLPNPMTATRYHSLVIDRASLPPTLEITAETKDGVIMGVRHTSKNIEGVQFHPESILTEAGEQMVRNWISSLPAVSGKGARA